MAPPPRIRINAQLPFPSQVTGGGPVVITKSSGIWSINLSFANLTAVPNGALASNLQIMVYNLLAGQYQAVLASALPPAYIFTGTTVPGSAGSQTVILGTVAAPTLTNTGQAFLYNTVANGAVLQGDGSTYDVTLVNKNGGVVAGVPTGSGVVTFVGSASPASAAGQTYVAGTLSSAPVLANNGQGALYNMTVNGFVLQGQGSTYDVTIANKNGGLALGNSTGTANLLYFGSLLGSGSGSSLGFATGTGAGGAVTQLTSRTTGVTINTDTGAITLFSAAGVAAWTTFTVTNSSVAATDVVHASMKSSTNTYVCNVTQTAAGSFNISFSSIVGTATDAPVINFVVIKGAAS